MTAPESASTFYLFATSLAAGVSAALLLVPARLLGRRIFILCSLISVTFYALTLFVRGLEVGAYHLGAAAVLLAYNVTLPKQGSRLSTLLLMAAVLLAGIGLAADSYGAPPLASLGHAPALFRSAWSMTSAALLGTSLVAMILGHWYLVVPGLSFGLLARLILALEVSLGLRALVTAAAAFAQREWFVERWQDLGPAGFSNAYGLFLGAQALFGLLAPAALAVMAHICVRDRSNQSATGILYVVVVFILIGEIISKHLLATSGVLI